jgi:serine/threonine-protein kinase RsbT
VIDDGPGITDIELAMQPGYSTAPDFIRELGFGAGMGLPNIKRCADEMKIESCPGKGTNLEFSIYS